MRETITMTRTDQQRTIVLTKLLVGELTIAEAAGLMRLSERQAWRLKNAFQRCGPAALVHGNRGRPSPRRLAEATRQRIIELAATRYVGINDSHLAELLAEVEGITVSRVAVPCILRAAGRAVAGDVRRAIAADVGGCHRRACCSSSMAAATTGSQGAGRD